MAKAQVIKFNEQLQVLMKRTMLSDEHRSLWLNFETILIYRSNIAFMIYTLQAVLYTFFKLSSWQQSQNYIDSGELDTESEAVAEKIYPFIKWAQISLEIGRVVLVLVSLKKPQVVKYYLYYQLILQCLVFTLPNDYGEDFSQEGNALGNMLIIIPLYFDLIKSCLAIFVA